MKSSSRRKEALAYFTHRVGKQGDLSLVTSDATAGQRNSGLIFASQHRIWGGHERCAIDGVAAFVRSTTDPNCQRQSPTVKHLFSGRYKALVVDGSGHGYLKTACDYVHLNPVRAKLLTAEQPLRAFVWSSFPEYLKAPTQRPPWLRVDRLFGEMGLPQDSRAGPQQFELRMEENDNDARARPA